YLASRDEIAVAALLHDIGKIVLLAAYDRYREIAFTGCTPEQRLALERSELGIDHAMAGGVLARRAGLPERLTAMIGGHHADDARPDVALVRLADVLAHYRGGHPVDQHARWRVAPRPCWWRPGAGGFESGRRSGPPPPRRRFSRNRRTARPRRGRRTCYPSRAGM